MKRSVLILVALILAAVIFVVVRYKRNGDPGNGTRIGLLAPLTGDRAPYGVAVRDAALLAFSEINADLTIPGTPITIIVEDTRSSTKDCVTAFEKLASQDRVGVVLGPVASSEVLSVAPQAERQRILLFTPTASAPPISNAGDFVFRNVPSDTFESAAMAEIAATKLGLHSVAILQINGDYGAGVTKVFSDAYEKRGGKVTTVQVYPDSTRDFRTLLLKIREANPEAVYFVGTKEMGTAVAQAREIGLTQRFISTAIFEDPEILSAAGSAAEGIVFTSITFDPANPDPRAVAFAKAYRQRFNREPDGYAASAYDAAWILASAAKACGSWKAEDLKGSLYRLQGFQGLLGDVKFDQNGDVTLPIKLKRVASGQIEEFTE